MKKTYKIPNDTHMTNRLVCTISMNMRQKPLGIRGYPIISLSRVRRSSHCKDECRMRNFVNASAAHIRLEGPQDDMSRRRSKKPGTTCTMSCWPAICIPGPDILRQITHRKRRGVLPGKHRLQMGYISCASWPPGVVSIRERFDEAFF